MTREQLMRLVALKDAELLSDPTYLLGLKAGAPIVCMDYDDHDGLELPDNIVRPCTSCGRNIQMRPFNEVAINALCIPCSEWFGESMASA